MKTEAQVLAEMLESTRDCTKWHLLMLNLHFKPFSCFYKSIHIKKRAEALLIFISVFI
jgi:hypothetical protein